MSSDFVLDAWAVLALLQAEEPAASRVRQLVAEAETGVVHLAMSVINAGEVFYRVGRARGRAEALATIEDMRRTAIEILPAPEELVFAAADLKLIHPISYADAFALATAQHLSATLLTGDPELTRLAGRYSIEALKRKENR